MSRVKILYGVRDGVLTHIDDVESGAACNCTCWECGRFLVAKKGDIRRNHFAHDADDVSCNPSPETLVHFYAKQQIANLSTLTLPGFVLRTEFEAPSGELQGFWWRHHPHYHLRVKSSEVEAEVTFNTTKVRPDVLFMTDGGSLAVEVYYRHKVPPEKIDKLRRDVYLSTVEVDLSDLPVESSSETINRAITDVQRWQWLHNQQAKHLQGSMYFLLRQANNLFVPKAATREPRIKANSLPSAKLAKADKLMKKAAQVAMSLRELPPSTSVLRVRDLPMELRVALHCYYIGVAPTKLPAHLMQAVDGMSALGMNPVLWQTGVFAKFCMSGGEFTAKMAELWVRCGFEDKALYTAGGLTQSANGFSPVAEALFHFLRNLSAQGLLLEIKRSKPWESTFRPIAGSRAEVLQVLVQHRPAIPEPV